MILYPLTPGTGPALRKTALASRALPFSVDTMDQNRVGEMHWHDYTQLWYTVSGSYTQIINGEKIEHTAGSLALILPYTVHSVDSSLTNLENTRVISVSIFEDLQSKNIMPFCPLTYTSSAFDKLLLNPYLKLCGKDKEAADRLFEDILSEYNRKYDMNRHSVFNSISKVFELMLRHSRGLISPIMLSRAYEQIAIIRAATEYITENSTKNLLLEDVAKYSLMSQRSFCGKFKECTGQTFYGFYNKTRMREVIRLLRFTQLTLQEIAEQCDFYDASHLRHVIKEHFGVTPVELRAQMLLRSRTHGEYLHERRIEKLGWINVMNEDEISIFHRHSIGIPDER